MDPALNFQANKLLLAGVANYTLLQVYSFVATTPRLLILLYAVIQILWSVAVVLIPKFTLGLPFVGFLSNLGKI